jgi:hypothetical protein
MREQMIKRLSEPIDAEALVFGRIDYEDGRRYYLGRGAVHDDHSKLLVINWRRPIAAPFYEAHRTDPQGLQLRRRFQLDQLRLLGIVDDVFGDTAEPRKADRVKRRPASRPLRAVPDVPPDEAEPVDHETSAADGDGRPAAGLVPAEDQAQPETPAPQEVDPQLRDAILADMNRARGADMRDIVATIEARQYELITDSIEGILTIQGGPGTGKTAIALHRAAWLLYNHRDELDRTGVLVVGPNRAFMEYVAQVLPTLGETAVSQRAVDRLTDLEDVRIRGVEEVEVARLKGDVRMAQVVQSAVSGRVRVPEEDIQFSVERTQIVLPKVSISALVDEARRASSTYLAGRDAFRRSLLALAVSRVPTGRGPFRRRISSDEIESALTRRGGPFDQIWPTVTAPEVLRDLFNSRQRLVAAGEGVLAEPERVLLQRERRRQLREEAWTAADIALLDEADAAIRGVRRSFGYVLADEAQDLSPMQLRMILRRSGRGRATLVGDIAQATAPIRFKDWDALLETVGMLHQSRVAELAIGYRVPSQITALAAQLLPRIAPDLLVPTAVRLGPEDPRVLYVKESALADELVRQVNFHLEGERSTGVIVAPDELDAVRAVLTQAGIVVGDVLTDGLSRQVTVLTAAQAKGLEFDHVLVIEPAQIAGAEEEWAFVYIALTRATRTLTVIHSTPKPFELPPAPEVEPEPAALTLSPGLETPEAVPGTVLGARYTEALMQAKFVHAGQHRRGTLVPYLAHLQAVAAIVLEDGGTEDEAIAALLHDWPEDMGPECLDQIVEQFGVSVARIVAGCTDPEVEEGASWRELKMTHMHLLESAGAHVRRVALAEKLDNARALLRAYRQMGARIWTRMGVDPEDLLWYQQELADLFVVERPGDLAWELRATVDRLLEVVSSPDTDEDAERDLAPLGADH